MEGIAQHIVQLLEAGGGQNGHAGNGGKVVHVKNAVVGLSVIAYKAGPVYTEDGVEMLEGHIMNQHIIAPL